LQRTPDSCNVSAMPHPNTTHRDSKAGKVVEEGAFGDERQARDLEAVFANGRDQDRKLSLGPADDEARADKENPPRAPQVGAS
jgi:hypothetical protein